MNSTLFTKIPLKNINPISGGSLPMSLQPTFIAKPKPPSVTPARGWSSVQRSLGSLSSGGKISKSSLPRRRSTGNRRSSGSFSMPRMSVPNGMKNDALLIGKTVGKGLLGVGAVGLGAAGLAGAAGLGAAGLAGAAGLGIPVLFLKGTYKTGKYLHSLRKGEKPDEEKLKQFMEEDQDDLDAQLKKLAEETIASNKNKVFSQ